jgi:hypothetical protein
MSENRYTTIFRPGDKGVTTHRAIMLTIMTNASLVLHGCNQNEDKLWTESTHATSQEQKEAASIYNLTSIGQTVKYLHAAAGYPTKEMWTKTIRVRNYNTWPTLTMTNICKHFPESNETQKGHIK